MHFDSRKMRYRTSALSDSRVQEKRSGNSGTAEEVEAIPYEEDDNDYSPYGGGGGLNVRQRRARAFQRSKCVVTRLLLIDFRICVCSYMYFYLSSVHPMSSI